MGWQHVPVEMMLECVFEGALGFGFQIVNNATSIDGPKSGGVELCGVKLGTPRFKNEELHLRNNTNPETCPDSSSGEFSTYIPIRSPQLASRLLVLALKALPEFAAVGHSCQYANVFRTVRIGVDPVDCIFFARLAAPPVRVGDEEQLVLSEVLQTWQVLVRLLVSAALPGLVGGSQTASISNVLAQCETSVHVEGLAIGSRHRELRILIDKTFGALLETLDR